MNRALKKGDEVIAILKELISELPLEKQKRIDIARWNDTKIHQNYNYDDMLGFLNSQFRINEKFRDYITSIVNSTLPDRSGRIFKEFEINRLSQYILDEIPHALNGFYFNKTYYNCHLYPNDTKFTQLIEKLQSGKIFPEIAHRVIVGSNTFVEAKLVL